MNTLTKSERFAEKDFLKYFELFNNNDFEGFARYYNENMTFQGRGRSFKSSAEMVDFYQKLKSRIRETVTLKEILIGEDEIAVEIETELYAFEDWLDMPTGSMRKGDTIRSRNFVWYELQNGKFEHIRSARYRRIGSPEQKSELPLQTASTGIVHKEQFASYVEAFNIGDYAALGECLSEDVLLGIGSKQDIKGRETVLDLCRALKKHAQASIEIKKFISSENLLAAELQFKLYPLDELSDFVVSLRKDSHILTTVFALCDLTEGKFVRIRLAKFSQGEL